MVLHLYSLVQYP